MNLFCVSDVTKVLSSSTTASSTTSNGLLIDLSASVRVQFDGFTWISSIFYISNDEIELIPSPRPFRASFTDNFSIELNISRPFFFWGNQPWNMALQFDRTWPEGDCRGFNYGA